MSVTPLLNYVLKMAFFITGLYILSPIYYTFTRSISSDSVWSRTASLIILHLFLPNYSGSPVRAPGALENSSLMSNVSLNASVVASLLIASRLLSRFYVFAVVLFSLQVIIEYRMKDASDNIVKRIGKLSLIDLAGSERALATDQRTLRSFEGSARRPADIRILLPFLFAYPR
ncbi:hypothetical protein Leryth_021916 [Lithospermum erythrorhizon]|nr:hypothetical protein Leryth_021916 [Lithospermum erythrorhizon]